MPPFFIKLRIEINLASIVKVAKVTKHLFHKLKYIMKISFKKH